MEKDYKKLYEDIAKSEWFRKAYHDKSLGECPVYVPELEESEDERIIKCLMEIVDWGCSKNISVECGVNLTDIRKWLEKQKLVKKTKKPKFSVGDKIRYSGAEYEITGIREVSDGYMYNVLDISPNPDNNSLFGVHSSYEPRMVKIVEQKEQKPAEYIKRNSKEWYALLSEQYDKGYWKGKAAQKPAEWSEEDEKNLDYCLRVLNGFAYEEADNAKDWLKSLRPQPKQEWSEKDKTIIEGACNALEIYGHTKLASMLKSLLSFLDTQQGADGDI